MCYTEVKLENSMHLFSELYDCMKKAGVGKYMSVFVMPICLRSSNLKFVGSLSMYMLCMFYKKG